MKNIFYLSLILVVFFTSCRNEIVERRLIDHAETLLETNPDSAYLLLDSITMADNMSDKLLAHWCMLYGKTADKLHEDMPYVSQLLRARTWYEKHGTSYEQAQIGLYLGRSYVEDREYMKAMDAYVQALGVAEKAKEYNVAGYISSYMGDLYELKGLFNETLSKYNQAADYFLKADNKRSYALALRDVARTFASEDSCSLALVILLKADSIITDLKDGDAIASISNGLGNIYRMIGDTIKAESYLLKSLEANPFEKAPSFLALSDLYMNMGDFEKARLYLKSSKIATKNHDTPVAIIYAEYEIEKKCNNIESALYNLEQYVANLDSIYNSTINLDILDAEKRYNHVMLLNENNKLRNNNLINIIVIIMILVFGLIIYIIYLYKNKEKDERLYEQELKLKDNNERISKLSYELEKKKNEIGLQITMDSNEKKLNLLRDSILEIENELTLLRKEKLQHATIVKKILKLSSKIVPGSKNSPLTDKDWNNLIKLIDETYISFYHFISHNNFGLSPAEVQYCYLSFLDLDIRSESILLNINSESVSKRKFRVRQKLGCIGKEISLYQCLINV